MAGVTLAAVGIPECTSYAKLAGTPLATGLYTLVFPMVAFAILGFSRALVVAGGAATAWGIPWSSGCSSCDFRAKVVDA